MPYRIHSTSCTVQRTGGDFCDAPSAEDMPFPICAKHAAELYRHVRAAMGAFGQDELFAAWHFFVEKPEWQREQERERRLGAAKADPLVYYVQVGEYIKIGFTTNLKQRLGGYPPHKRLLAVEPGEGNTEGRRLLEFRHLLSSGNEWFQPGPDLIRHINGLRSKLGKEPIPIAA